MFYVKIDRPVNLKGERQMLYTQINGICGVRFGKHLVKDGKIKGPKGEVRYFDYLPLFENLPTFRGHWDDTSPIEEIGDKQFITIDLFLENGLLLEKSMKMELHEVNYFPGEDGGGYLLLCSNNEYYFQVIAR